MIKKQETDRQLHDDRASTQRNEERRRKTKDHKRVRVNHRYPALQDYSRSGERARNNSKEAAGARIRVSMAVTTSILAGGFISYIVWA